MEEKYSTPEQILDGLLARYPELSPCVPSLRQAFDLMCNAYCSHGKLLCCGNGGSAADSEHISGELMKGFLRHRPLDNVQQMTLRNFGEEGTRLAENLQKALPCIALTGHPALNTAFSNDVDPQLCFAQQVLALGQSTDVLLAISTSGNARNCIFAAITAKSQGLSVIGLTGRSGGHLASLCDVAICAPADETYRIQEYHLPIYHALCAMLEAYFFSE